MNNSSDDHNQRVIASPVAMEGNNYTNVMTVIHTDKGRQTFLQSRIMPLVRPEAHRLASASSHSSSKGIPIKGLSMQRTHSELQLMESEMLAEHRDYCMYKRIVDGMSRQNSTNSCSNASWTSDDSLANIIRTRHTPVVSTDGFSSHFQEVMDHGYPYPSDTPSQSTHSQLENFNLSQTNLVFEDDCREQHDEIFELDM
jgi:hypothetical protein